MYLETITPGHTERMKGPFADTDPDSGKKTENRKELSIQYISTDKSEIVSNSIKRFELGLGDPLCDSSKVFRVHILLPDKTKFLMDVLYILHLNYCWKKKKNYCWKHDAFTNSKQVQQVWFGKVQHKNSLERAWIIILALRCVTLGKLLHSGTVVSYKMAIIVLTSKLCHLGQMRWDLHEVCARHILSV